MGFAIILIGSDSMVKVKSLEEAKKNLEDIVPVIGKRYERGIKRAKPWKEGALAGQALYEEKMTNPDILKRRAKRIETMTDEDWRRPALELGVRNIGPGLKAKIDKWAGRWAPYRSALEAVELPPKTADPEANIDNRLKPIVRALVEKKKELLGG